MGESSNEASSVCLLLLRSFSWLSLSCSTLSYYLTISCSNVDFVSNSLPREYNIPTPCALLLVFQLTLKAPIFTVWRTVLSYFFFTWTSHLLIFFLLTPLPYGIVMMPFLRVGRKWPDDVWWPGQCVHFLTHCPSHHTIFFFLIVSSTGEYEKCHGSSSVEGEPPTWT